jgi:hypothetical protein
LFTALAAAIVVDAPQQNAIALCDAAHRESVQEEGCEGFHDWLDELPLTSSRDSPIRSNVADAAATRPQTNVDADTI